MLIHPNLSNGFLGIVLMNINQGGEDGKKVHSVKKTQWHGVHSDSQGVCARVKAGHPKFNFKWLGGGGEAGVDSETLLHLFSMI